MVSKYTLAFSLKSSWGKGLLAQTMTSNVRVKRKGET